MNAKLKCVSAVVSITFLLSQSASASSQITAHLLNFGTYGNGNVYLSLDQSINEPGCSMPYLELPAAGSAAKAVLATAALALAINATVTLQTDTCYNGVPSFSGARAAFFTINKP